VGIYMSLFGVYMSFLGIYMSFLGIYMSLLGIYMSLLGMYMSPVKHAATWHMSIEHFCDILQHTATHCREVGGWGRVPFSRIY